ncbi:MAG: M28 family metallopeptidase [Cyclobacteriaceae bacterium]|nr:M28 family metallopeptidase [Cyclobacteriaceae bacterium]MDH4294984.1 M28 family metallopeptidase [Cyclobacteriaceae bacterium]MDH5249022.1 M28 family metallopeptidase [Cyclobacteriaceae bacterium]
MNRRIFALAVSIIAGLMSCKQSSHFDPEDGLNSISGASISQCIKTFSSDEFEGRRPFTQGEKKSLAFLEEQFNVLTLEPGNGDSYLQEVPMVEITPTADTIMNITGIKNSVELTGFEDYVLWTERPDSLVSWKDEELVFAGFGIVAPEYNWDDYKDLDVKGKVVMVLVNDPGFGGGDAKFFKGDTMTYYGRWTYKFEEAARQGAKGCLVIHNTVSAGYGFWVVQNNWNAPHLYLNSRSNPVTVCEAIGWTSMPAAEKLFNAAGLDFNTLQLQARTPGFKGLALDLTLTTNLHVKSVYNTTYNAVAKITGAEKPEEYIIYSAHWDHLGIGTSDDAGDSIYNGAIDNAGGVATVLEIAKAFKSMKNKTRRTIVFLFVTAEEQGLWGSAFYAQNPIYPISKTLANINVDFANVAGKMKDITVIGIGQSTLEDDLKEAAARQGRYLAPDPTPEAGLYFRSDHFNFAKVGIPALFVEGGIDHAEQGKEYGLQQNEDYNNNRYHQPDDEFDADHWDLYGVVEDASLLFQLGKQLSFAVNWPEWKTGSEFKSIRERGE